MRSARIGSDARPTVGGRDPIMKKLFERGEDESQHQFPGPVRLRTTERYRHALLLLLDAHLASCEHSCDPWEFAIEIQSLRDVGLSDTDFRSLLKSAHLVHAREMTQIDELKRVFHPCASGTFSRRSCFVLSVSGVELAMQICGEAPRMGEGLIISKLGTAPARNGIGDPSAKPRWDPDRRELLFEARLIKQFKVPAYNQQAILAAFDEEGWPIRIDDPLPPKEGKCPKERLHQAIKNLNRNQKEQLIRFAGDGSGTGVCWQVRTEAIHGLKRSFHRASVMIHSRRGLSSR